MGGRSKQYSLGIHDRNRPAEMHRPTYDMTPTKWEGVLLVSGILKRCNPSWLTTEEVAERQDQFSASSVNGLLQHARSLGLVRKRYRNGRKRRDVEYRASWKLLYPGNDL